MQLVILQLLVGIMPSLRNHSTWSQIESCHLGFVFKGEDYIPVRNSQKLRSYRMVKTASDSQ